MEIKEKNRNKKLIRLSVSYAILSGLWIVLSDKFLSMIVGDNIEKLEVYSISKGLFFVFATSFLFYFFCKKWEKYLKNIEEVLVKRIEAEIIDETKYKRVFDVANDALFIVDKESLRFLSVNASACKMYGYTNDEFINKLNILDLAAQFEKSKYVIENEIIRVEHGIHKKSDGTIFHVDITITYFTVDGNRTLAASVRDMTAHYSLVHDLKSNEQKYIEAQLLGNVGNWNWNMKTNHVSWSPGMYKIHGIEQNELPITEEGFFCSCSPRR